MRKSKPKLDLNISREVTQRIIEDLMGLLDETLKETSRFPELQTKEWSFPVAYLRDSFLSKYVDENTDPAETRRTRAIVKWLAVEQRNAKTNTRLFTTNPNFTVREDGTKIDGWSILMKAAKTIKRVLGEGPPAELLSEGMFSGGATTSRKRGPACLPSKFMGSMDSTAACWAEFKDTLSGFPVWTTLVPEAFAPNIVHGNVLFTVPKTTVIDRVACKEPDVNIFCQKAVGDYIRRQLKRSAKIDLNDQSVNRGLAKTGSIRGNLATIDLSSASDSLTTSLVQILLPRPWFNLLAAIRSPITTIDGHLHENEMFSSMGNGFTFELESLVFWALAHATCHFGRNSGRISVYGDDIIIPRGIASAFLHVLSWVGFTPNVKKTFVKGPFRESCGGHYYRGLDVTPFYLRRPLKDVSDLVLFLNQFRAWIIRVEADTLENGYDTPNAYVQMWYKYARLVPKSLWGGYSLESRTQLASKGPQKCELLGTTRRWEKLEVQVQTGLYLSRLCVLNKRGITETLGDVATDFSILRVPTQEYVMRRCTVEPAVFGLVRPLFITEQW